MAPRGRSGLEKAALALGVKPSPGTPPKLTAATKVVVAGGAALLSTAELFAADRSLSWSDQVVAVASSPRTRQLAGLCAVALQASARTVVLRPAEDVRATLRAAGFAQVDHAIVSADAEPDCAGFARAAAGGR